MTPALNPTNRRQRGFTLTELMVSLVLGALVVLAATAMVASSRGTYRTQDESTRVQESSRFALELVDRMVRLAGYTDFGETITVPPYYSIDTTWSNSDSYALNGPNVVGSDHSSPSGNPVINGSDSLTIRFYGSGDPGTATGLPTADGNVLDCAGSAVAPPRPDVTSYSNSRAYDVLFVDTDSDGEPALKCRRQIFDPTGVTAPVVDTQTLIRGVESFQLLFGEANYTAGADPDLVAPLSITYRTGIGGVNPVLNWSNVVTVRVAILMRSNVGAQADSGAQTYNLFGSTYPNGSTDVGVQFPTNALSTSERTRIRRIVETTIFVRNRLSQWPSLN